jgi:dimethylargininase
MLSFFRKFDTAVLKQPGKEIVEGLSLNKEKNPLPDYQKALEQHTCYAKTLRQLGVNTVVLGPTSTLPDGCFVEDTYLITNDFVIRLRSAAPTRAKESKAIFKTIEELTLPRKMYSLPKEYTMDGGDILVIGKRIYIGMTSRTSFEAIEWVKKNVVEGDYDVQAVQVPQGLHLKSGVTALTPDVFMVLPEFEPIMKELHRSLNEEKTFYTVTPGEERAANILPINGGIIIPPNCPNAEAFVLKYYQREMIHKVDTSEFEKVDGLLTCLSIPLNTKR